MSHRGGWPSKGKDRYRKWRQPSYDAWNKRQRIWNRWQVRHGLFATYNTYQTK